MLPAGTAAGNFTVEVFCVAQSALGATARSESVGVQVTWDAALLSDPSVQKALVGKQTSEARSKARLHSRPSLTASVSFVRVRLALPSCGAEDAFW